MKKRRVFKTCERVMRSPISSWLLARGMFPVFEVQLSGMCDIVGVSFAEAPPRRVPEVNNACAVELKLSDVACAIRQATSYHYHVPRSWIAMPADRIAKMRDHTLDKFRLAGVGLLSVDAQVVTIVVESAIKLIHPTDSLRRKLWRRRGEFTKSKRFADIRTDLGLPTLGWNTQVDNRYVDTVSQNIERRETPCAKKTKTKVSPATLSRIRNRSAGPISSRVLR